ncbi:hypothetical protein ACIA5A_19205 [Micromonospora sp. NPDC051300]|uniref:hypothetical protein n=1 Tax=Micromonospora sp. NPDC051300 TaxID=3364286 RepID=UPI0037BC0BEC
MPFLDDTGPRDDSSRGPVAQAFAVFAGQVERLVVVNLLWALQLVPGFAAVAFGDVLPTAVRLVLAGWTAIALAAGTAVLYAVAALAADGGHVGISEVREAVREFAGPGVRVLGPLYAGFGFLLWLLALPTPVPATVLAGWLALLTLLIGGFWGPELAAHPEQGAARVLANSVRAWWRRPGGALTSAVVWVLLAAFGVLSVGGMFLAVPVLIALVQTETLRRASLPTRQVAHV